MELHPEVKSALDGIRISVEGFNGRFAALQNQLDAVDAKMQRGGSGADFSQKNNGVIDEIMAKLAAGRESFATHKTLCFEVSSPTLSAKSVVTTGLTTATAAPEIGNAGSFNFGVRELFQTLPLDAAGIFQIRETDGSGWGAAPQNESETKHESSTVLSGDVIPVRTVATWVSASRQALDDVAGLQSYLDRRLLWALAREVEAQILSGDGTGQNLTGLIPQATAFDTSLLLPFANYDSTTVIGAASTQLRCAGFSPSFVIMNPADAFAMRFTHDAVGQFIAAPPSLPQVIESPAMSRGQFLAGDSSQAVVRVKMKAVIDLSESHDDFFTRNMVAIRAEERLALQVVSPSAFVTGTFSQSPA